MKKISKKFRNIIFIVGLTAVSLVILALLIVLGEQLNLIQFYVGSGIAGLSPLDTWLIIILCIFAPVFFISYYFLFRMKVLRVD